jgi:hypothetical protein
MTEEEIRGGVKALRAAIELNDETKAAAVGEALAVHVLLDLHSIAESLRTLASSVVK